jgi:hypothetical protein
MGCLLWVVAKETHLWEDVVYYKSKARAKEGRYRFFFLEFFTS